MAWLPPYKVSSSNYLFAKSLAAGEGVEPSISAFKAQHVASYTIPQTEGGRMKECFQNVSHLISSFILPPSSFVLVGALGLEPRTLR
jgi:hypothetical protein